MQLTETIFSLSTIFIGKKRLENWLLAKSEFLWAKINYSSAKRFARIATEFARIPI